MQISRIQQHKFNNLPAKTQREYNPQLANVTFTAGLPKSSFFAPLKKLFKPVTDRVNLMGDKLVNGIALGYAKLIKTDTFKTVVEKSAKVNVVEHLSALIGLMISGLYIKRTLSSDKLAPEQKTTLAINQGIVSGVATSLGYVVTGGMNNQVNKFVRKYAAVNYNDNQLKSLKMGVQAAASMAIFSTMYRYVAPVLVTPVANAIGNKVQAHKKASAAKAMSQTSAQSPQAQTKAATAQVINKVA
jgi:hypothetical protein